MKRVAIIIAWVGIAVLLAGSIPTLNISWWWITRPETAGRVTEGVIVSVALSILGVLLSGIGGFFARSRIVAWGIIIAGAVYLLAFAPWAIRVPSGHEWLIALPPGIIAVLYGCALLTTRHRGWWFLGVFAIPVAALLIAVLGVLGVFDRPPVYQPVALQPPEAESGEVKLTLKPDGGYYCLVATEKDGYTREYLRLWVHGAPSKDIEVRTPRNGMLMRYLWSGDVPLDQISIPAVGYEAWVYCDGPRGPWRLEPPGKYTWLLKYDEHASWVFNLIPTCVSYTKHSNDESYVIFRLKEHIPGERLVIEYRSGKPVPR